MREEWREIQLPKAMLRTLNFILNEMEIHWGVLSRGVTWDFTFRKIFQLSEENRLQKGKRGSRDDLGGYCSS